MIKGKTPTIISTWIPVVLRTYAACGLDADTLLAAAGIDKQLLSNPEARISISDYEQLWRLATERTKDPCLGLKVVPFLRPTTFHALGLTLLASSTIREALLRLGRYYRIISDEVNVGVIDSNDRTALCFSPLPDRSPPIDASVDAFMAVSIAYARTLSDDTLRPAKVAFMHPEPADIKPFRDLFQGPLSFSAGDNRIYFDNEDVHRPLSSANAEIAFRNDQIAAEYLARFEKTQIGNQVRVRIVEFLSSGEPGLEKIARSMGMSRRSLNRGLQKERTSYRDLLEDVRRQLAARYILRQDLSVIEIAFLLGYADSSNFTRAFKRWFGDSPKGYRAGRRTGS